MTLEGFYGDAAELSEVRMYLDGDSDLPTICGTGLEDYVASTAVRRSSSPVATT